MKRRIILLGFLSVCYGLKAQESDKDIYSMSLEELMNIEITTASKRAQKISDAPATVISFSATQIEQYGWRDLKDMFRAVTGVDVSYDVQGEVKTLVTMRGVEGNQKILILQDGQRQNAITGERFIFGHNIPLSIYKRIEIVYGPASALYGADAYAGVVNLITKDGADIDGFAGSVGYISTQAVDAQLSFGKKIDENTDVMLFGRIYNGQDFLLHKFYDDSLDYRVVDTYRGQLGALEKVYPISNWNFLGKIRYGKLLLGFDWQHQLESNAPSCIPSNYAYVKNNVWGQDIRHFYTTFDFVKSDNFNLDATLTLGDYAINPASNFYIPLDTNNDGYLDSGSPGYKYGYSGYAQLSVKSDWTISEKLNLIYGISADNVKSFPKTQNLTEPYHLDAGFADDLRYFVDSNGYTFGLLGLTDSIFGERNFQNFGTFLQAQYSPLQRLTITLGGRFDYNSIYKETFNPRLGVIYKATEKLTLKALAGSAYIAPSNYYRWENWANPYAMHIPNMNIRPEKLQSYEFSAIVYPTKSLSVRTSLFRNNMTDIIRPIAAPAQSNGYPYFNPLRNLIGESPNSGFVEINGNLGSIYSQGLELDLNYQYRGFLFMIGYSFTDGEDKETNAKIPKVSQHKLNGNITYTSSKFFGGLTIRYYSDIWPAPSNSLYAANGTVTGNISGATILYINAGYNVTKNITATLAVDNILNTKHYGAAPYGESIWIQPRAPQSLMKIFGGLKFRF